MDELSNLANANVGETNAECDINRLAEQGAVYCQMLEDIDDTCFNFGRVDFVSLITLIITWQFDLTIRRPKFIEVNVPFAPDLTKTLKVDLNVKPWELKQPDAPTGVWVSDSES